MLYNLPDDIILYIIKKIQKYNPSYILNIISINHTFKNIVPFQYLKQCRLDYLLHNKIPLRNCCNDNCYWDSYLDIYDEYSRYIHYHQPALNFVLLSYNNSKKYTNIYIPYCFECMQKYNYIQIYP